MSKIYSLQPIALHSTIKAEDFEKFVKEELPQTANFPGWKVRVLKGERGDREGKYMLLIEIESFEARNRYFPRPDEPSEEVKRFLETHPENAKFFEKWGTLASDVPGFFTDYVEIE